MKNPITVQTIVKAPIAKVWEYWNQPEHIVNWAFASNEWEVPSAESDLRVGGMFKTRMKAKDGSAGFDFSGKYTAVKVHTLIEYNMVDGRHVKVEFEEVPDGVRVLESFDPENENSEDTQRTGWQAMLDNFKNYVEKNSLSIQ